MGEQNGLHWCKEFLVCLNSLKSNNEFLQQYKRKFFPPVLIGQFRHGQ